MRARVGFAVMSASIVVAVVAACPSPAAAAETGRVFLAADVLNEADGLVHRLPGMRVAFTVGLSRSPVYLTGQVSARSQTTNNVLQSARITCHAPNGDVAYLRTDRNNEGYDAYAGQPLDVLARFLYRPRVPGRHSCELGIQALSAAGDDLALRVLAGRRTYLAYASPKPHAVSFSTKLDRYDSTFSRTCPGGEPCAAATHLGRNAAGIVLPAGLSEAVTTSPVVRASSAAVALDIISDLNLSVCYAGTSTCPRYAEGSPSIWRAGTTIVARLVVEQLRADGSPCVSTATPWLTFVITSAAHHRKLHLRMPTFHFLPLCGAVHAIKTSVHITWISGNPLRVEPEGYRTTGIIMERYQTGV